MVEINTVLSNFITILAEEAENKGPFSPEAFIYKIIPNGWAFLIQLLALIVMIIVFFCVGYKPVRKIIKARQDYSQEKITSAEEKDSKAAENLKDSENTLLETRKKADEMIETAKKQTIIEQQAIVDKANAEVIKMKQDAINDIEKKKLQAQEDVKKEIVNVALLASSELLKRETNTKDNEKLVQQFIDDMDREDGSN